jgi:hypothetical protein
MVSLRSKQLLVEGQDDKFAIVGLMEHHISWSDRRDEAPVFIDAVGSVSEILDATFIRTKLKESRLDILGIMIDADDDPKSRWYSFRSLCGHAFPDLPAALPAEGLVIQNERGLRLGLWLMPDCSSGGMLETSLRYLVPDDAEAQWKHAEASFEAAVALGSPCRPAHADKGRVHTWLAWQDPPGESFGRALTRRTLDPESLAAGDFVAWLKHLYVL